MKLFEDPDEGEPDASGTDPANKADAGGTTTRSARGHSQSFQSASTAQGQMFADQCDLLLRTNGFTLAGKLVLAEIGVEIDQVGTTADGRTLWFEYKGSVQGKRPGLRRTDTLKKAIANGALLRDLPEACPYVVLTSHLPDAGSGKAMLDAALRLGYFHRVVCAYDTADVASLAGL